MKIHQKVDLWQQKKSRFRAIFYPKQKLFYMDHVHASLINSMSAMKIYILKVVNRVIVTVLVSLKGLLTCITSLIVWKKLSKSLFIYIKIDI